jgi:hypothetical protein
MGGFQFLGGVLHFMEVQVFRDQIRKVEYLLIAAISLVMSIVLVSPAEE